MCNLNNNLGWETLENRRKKVRSAMLYKIWHGAIDMDTGDILRLNDRRTSQQRLCQPTAAVNVYKNSFVSQNHPRLESPLSSSYKLPDYQGVQSRPRTTAADSQKLKRQLCF